MSLSIVTRRDGRVTILELHGKVTLGPPLRGFQSRARRVLNEPGCSGLVLNLADLTAIDSAGIGGLVAIHSSASRRRLRVVLVAVTPRIRELLAITRVDALFHFVLDEQSAVREIRESRERGV